MWKVIIPWILLFLLFLCSCGTVEYVDDDVVNYSWEVASSNWVYQFGDMPVSPDNYPVEVEYQAELPDDARGITYTGNPTLIQIHQVDEYDMISCIEVRYVLAHEFLHYLSYITNTCTSEENHTHEVPFVFIQWAFNNNKPSILAVEHPIYMEVKYFCKDKWGE